MSRYDVYLAHRLEEPAVADVPVGGAVEHL